ncbi:hypothetical protein LOAG_14204 [Loa loa]|uniref:Uncharacterized protein n=1 Tax=Loa loa TaxID=7209 RepID=A0A1S0TI64_LOALO|nr:hypothetical protein LOAG_14204 [Loa loa]EFO14318.1 hypothetical protein LOAG_14204 [Loa loa]
MHIRINGFDELAPGAFVETVRWSGVANNCTECNFTEGSMGNITGVTRALFSIEWF